MSRCPKCGASHIVGPRYVTHSRYFGGTRDALRYTCAVCGYVEDKPTKDKRC